MISVKQTLIDDGKRRVFSLDSDGEIVGSAVVYQNCIEKYSIITADTDGKKQDFLLRSVIFALANSNSSVTIDFVDSYFEQFGFEAADGKMQAESLSINLKNKCVHTRTE